MTVDLGWSSEIAGLGAEPGSDASAAGSSDPLDDRLPPDALWSSEDWAVLEALFADDAEDEEDTEFLAEPGEGDDWDEAEGTDAAPDEAEMDEGPSGADASDLIGEDEGPDDLGPLDGVAVDDTFVLPPALEDRLDEAGTLTITTHCEGLEDEGISEPPHEDEGGGALPPAEDWSNDLLI